MNVFTTTDGGLMISGYLEDADGQALRDPKDNNQPFRLQLGIEDWTIAMALGAQLIEGALQQRSRILRDIEHDERREQRQRETSALFNAPEGEDPVL